MDCAEALWNLGVRETTLTPQELDMLDMQGYLPLRGVLTMDQVNALRERQAQILAEEGDRAGLEVHQEKGTDRLANLIDKGTVFHIVLNQPRVLAAIAHVLKYDMKLSSLNSRNALPGQGLQGLHADWGRLETPGDYQVCNTLWLLDDFTPDNGATRVVPGKHLGTALPGDEMANPAGPHPDEVVLLGTAGDVVVVNSHLWHGGTTNRTEGPRRVMHGYWCRRQHKPQNDWQRYLHRSSWDQLNPNAQVLLGINPPEA